MGLISWVSRCGNSDSAVECIPRILSRLHVHVVIVSQAGVELLPTLVIADFLLLFMVRALNHESPFLGVGALAERLLSRLVEVRELVFTWRVVILLILDQANAGAALLPRPIYHFVKALPTSLILRVLLLSLQLLLRDAGFREEQSVA